MRTILAALAIGFIATTTAVYAQPMIGGSHTVAVAAGDTLSSLGSRFGIDPATIARDNARAPDAPLRVGEVLRLDNRHIIPAFTPGTTLLVNVPQRMLFFAAERGVTAFPVGVGRAGWPTPLGTFSIVSKEVDPTWDVPESIREEARRAGRSLPAKVPPGPNNPLGAYWIGLSVGSIGIHGTNAPTSVYHAVTHGCIRLRASDIEALFSQVEVGAGGTLVYQPILVAVESGQVFVEAHRDVYGRGPRDALDFVRSRARELGVYEQIDWTVAAQALQERAGIARPVNR
jgi:L,D-transpeptidase ErfK/SrfK